MIIGSDGAVISVCQRYRTILWRDLDGQREPLVFVMLNPSTADATKPDPTITRCHGFARRENAGGIIVVNLAPWRTAYPKELEAARRRGEDVLWEKENREAMLAAAAFGPFIFAWGAGIRPWMDSAARMAREVGGGGRCLGRTKTGEPRHPLMLANNTPMVAFP